MSQPYLHELVTVVAAPAVALSERDGQMRGGAHGFFCADRRVLSRAIVTLDDTEPLGVASTLVGSGRHQFLAVVRHLGDDGDDPTVTVVRERAVGAAGLTETIVVGSTARAVVRTRLAIQFGCDLAGMDEVKAGRPGADLAASRATDGALQWRGTDGSVVAVTCDPAPDSVDGARLAWTIDVLPGESVTVTVDAGFDNRRPAAVVAPSRRRLRDRLSVVAGDFRLSALVERSLADLDALALTDPLARDDRFLAAGAPWYLTLFGRDAIWAARMLLPAGTEVAAGTLRALARRQGTIDDPASAQQPGKILHELRPAASTHLGGTIHLPPLYYGTIDATPLWISLLHDSWRAGLPALEVEALLPNLDRAMSWLTDHALDDRGFVSYRDSSGTGLANQGWKDSPESVRFGDGAIAGAPIALCEVQAYAHAAARQAADLADAFDRPRAHAWRTWAAELRDRFRAAFWVDNPRGRYPAIALDADGRPVDTVTSNIGHLLGTGLLDPDEEAVVVDRLARPDLDSGFGLRTLSDTASAFNPLSYHLGSVWAHDTAIAITGLATCDAPAAPAAMRSLAGGLLGAAPHLDFSLPELFGGQPRQRYPAPVPYPASCRPQAWSATASIAIVAALLGLRIDVPNETVRLRPLRPSLVGALDVAGLRFGGHEFAVHLDDDGDPSVAGLPRSIRVEVT